MSPPNYAQALERGLIVKEGEEDVHTFSNGSEGDAWMEPNCYACRFYEREGRAGEFCAFEAAAFLHQVSPELATLFGWTRNEKYPEEFDAPESCRFFRSRDEDNGERPRRSTPTDPAQLVLIADPTEDAATITAPAIPAPRSFDFSGRTQAMSTRLAIFGRAPTLDLFDASFELRQSDEHGAFRTAPPARLSENDAPVEQRRANRGRTERPRHTPALVERGMPARLERQAFQRVARFVKNRPLLDLPRHALAGGVFENPARGNVPTARKRQ